MQDAWIMNQAKQDVLHVNQTIKLTSCGHLLTVLPIYLKKMSTYYLQNVFVAADKC